MGTIRSI